ncbi:MAG: GNAT family N-acetyltransferase, partial [Pseudomonadota bacterium]
MNIELRAAEERDIPGIAAVWNVMIRETLSTFTSEEKSEDALRASLQEKRAACLPVLVASCDGIFAGFATYGPFRSGPGYAATVEVTIYLVAAAQGTGQAGKLLQSLLDHAAGEGKHIA